MKTIYAVRTRNFIDTLYYETLEDAQNFVDAQSELGIRSRIRKQQVSGEKYNRLMATMELPDGQGDRS